MKEKTKYDIFVSYRRTAHDSAKLIAEKLRFAGYRVFFDVDTLTAGKFNEQLLEVIGGCKDFILVLPENALDRCVDENDWIRRETSCAIEHQKNIIPVMLDGFVWPSVMPDGLAELRNYQAITAVNREFFDMAVTRLRGYLKSKPIIPIKKWLTMAVIVLTVLFIFVGVGYGIARHVAGVACERIASTQASTMSAVDALNDIRHNIEETSSTFFSAAYKAKSAGERELLEQEFEAFLNKEEKEISTYQRSVPVPEFKLDGIESYVLAFYGVKQEELKGFTMYYSSLYDDFDNSISFMRKLMAMHDYSQNSGDAVKMDLQVMSYAINAFYYAYLGCLSLLPKSSRSTHYELSKKWRHFPNGTPLDLSQEEYEQFQAIEMNHMNDIIYKMAAQVNYEEQKLRDLENQNKE